MKKTIMIWAITLCILMAGVMAANNALTWSTPNTTDNIIRSATQFLNVSVTYGASNLSYVEFYLTPSGGTAWLVGNDSTYNSEKNRTHYNVTFDATNTSDDTSYTLTAKAYNFSANLEDTETLVVIADNTKPNCTQSSLVSGATYNPVGSVVTVTAVNASGCNLKFGSNVYGMTESSDVCTYTLTNVPEGTYNVIVTNTDGVNTTDCTQVNSVTLDKSNKVGTKAMYGEIAVTEGAKKSNKTTIIAAVLLIGAAMLLLRKKK